MDQAVVVYCPHDPVSIGSVITGPAKIAKMEFDGRAMLPVDPETRFAALGHYVRHSHVDLVGHAPVEVRLALEKVQGQDQIHWMVGLLPIGPNPIGNFSLVPNMGDGMYGSAHLSARTRSVVSITPRDFRHGDIQIVGGRSECAGAGLVGMAVRAVADQLRVLWVAASQCRQPHLPRWMSVDG